MIVYKFLKLFGIWILFIFFFVIFHHFVNSIWLDSILILFFFFRLIKSIRKLLCGRHSASIIFFININFVLYFTRIDILILLIFIRIKITKMFVHKFLKLFGIWILSIFFFVIFHHFVNSFWLDSILSLFELFIHELSQLCCCWLSSIMWFLVSLGILFYFRLIYFFSLNYILSYFLRWLTNLVQIFWQLWSIRSFVEYLFILFNHLLHLILRHLVHFEIFVSFSIH